MSVAETLTFNRVIGNRFADRKNRGGPETAPDAPAVADAVSVVGWGGLFRRFAFLLGTERADHVASLMLGLERPQGMGGNLRPASAV